MMPGSPPNEEEMKRYLFRELSPTEAQAFEERLFEDSDYFYDVLGLEDDLVDSYAVGRLTGSDLVRFERSLHASPGRREKVSVAVALQRRVAEGRRAGEGREDAPEASAARPSVWEQITGLFSLQSRGLRYAAVGLMVLLTLGCVFLAIERYRLGSEVARLRAGQTVEARRREEELRREVAAAGEREEELKRRMEGESGKAELLKEQLEAEGAERARLERELERLRTQREATPTPAPAVASIFLMPSGRGSGGAEDLSVGRNVGRVTVGLGLEEGLSPDARFSVELNGGRVAAGLRPRRLPSGRLLVTVNVSPRDLSQGANRMVVRNAEGLPVGDYEFNVRKR